MNTYAILGIIVTLCGLVWWIRRAGVTAERVKQAEAELKAIDVADEVQNDVGAMPPDKRREELKQWGAAMPQTLESAQDPRNPNRRVLFPVPKNGGGQGPY